jgi:RNA polymerase-binding protein DksA
MASHDELHARLENDRAHLLERLDALRADSAMAGETREGSPFGKREEEATEAFELEKRMALERQLTDSIAEVEQALAKFDTNSYGKCEQCGREIEHERLEARPQAKLCMTCKAHERI